MNSSTSSCGCNYEECCCYGVDSNYRRVWNRPYYSNIAHPLVYYAQVPPTCKKQKSRETKQENPNCFVKAFKWYTQEHRPPQRNQFSNFTPNMTGFAAWLDSKYQQFVLESHMDRATYLFKMHESSSFEPYETIKSRQENLNVKKHSRVKSPWKKRRNHTKEGGDMSQKSHHSFEYILQPKEISHNVSDWCQPTPTFLRNRSNVTIVSMDVRDGKKPTRSLSLTSVQDIKSNETYVAKEAKKRNQKQLTKDILKDKLFDVSCQCFEDKPVQVATGTQYDDFSKLHEEVEKEIMSTPVQELPKKGTVRKIIQEFDPKRHVWCQCSDEATKMDAFTECDLNTTWTLNNIPQETKTNAPVVPRPLKDVKSAVTNTFVVSNSNTFMSSPSQTTDNAINLGSGMAHQYPFFMRIVCADKLCDDCIHRQM